MWHSQDRAGRGYGRGGCSEKGAKQLPRDGKCVSPPAGMWEQGQAKLPHPEGSQPPGHKLHQPCAQPCWEERVKELPERRARPGNSAADAGTRCAGEAPLSRHRSVTSPPALQPTSRSTTWAVGADQGHSLGCHPTRHCPGRPGPPWGAHPSPCCQRHGLSQPFSWNCRWRDAPWHLGSHGHRGGVGQS